MAVWELRRWARLGAAVAVAGVLVAGPAHAEVTDDWAAAPPGANDWGCVPTAEHPEPVLLVHGTWGNQRAWAGLAPQLKQAGVCVFSLNYGQKMFSVRGSEPGVYGTADIRSSAKEIAAFVGRVRKATGARRVDVVAHSQGGPLVRQYLRFEGGAELGPEVRRLVTLAATHHGTTADGLGQLLPSGSASATSDTVIAKMLGTAAAQQLAGSEFLRRLNAAGDTEPGIEYTAIATRMDHVVTPPEATFLQAGPGATVDNVWVQDVCPTDTFHHGILPDSPAVSYLVHEALDLPFAGTPCPSIS
ncbi:triacylglycerol lipase [Nocardia sp. XZ_19_385]|uniref:esterase/lipase family protein n=1 Tax=Nocardia sp. XZ_19_385 TaxID=2769488 RepID=UPI00188E6C5E|nr:alpha/beta fold hydrolase [Nocardia sp. XZ_19_385]